MKVPFLDLKLQYDSIREEIDTAIHQVLEKTAFAGGPFVENFENHYADFCDTEHAIGVSSGTSAIWLALLAMDIGPGDEVITVPNTFIATVEAISFTGATPVFVDIDEATYTMNPEKLEAAITPKTRAVIPVHLYGQMADMDPITAIAKKHGLKVIEDAAQAQGARYKGRRAGSTGDAGCFSFYPGKNLGAFGEAGAVVTDQAEIADKIRMIQDHGQSSKYHHDCIGWNGRMDGIQGAVLDVKLKYIDQWNQKRREHAATYSQHLSSLESVRTPFVPDQVDPIFHVYAVRIQNRDKVLEAMKEAGVACGIHYPVPVHRTQAYRHLNLESGTFPVSETIANELLSLPMFPELTSEQIAYTADTLQQLV